MSIFYNIPIQSAHQESFIHGHGFHHRASSSYAHVREIQSGTFATVSLFQQYNTSSSSSPSTQVAVKKISNSSTYNRNMISNEIKILNRLSTSSSKSTSNKNICQLIDHFPSNGSSDYNLVFEYCQYGDLYDFLKLNQFQSDLDFSNFLKSLINDVCSAIQFCHNSNIYHRDIKPENIFITENFSFKLGDFGLSKLASQNSSTSRLVFDDWDVGTDKYMAPECIQLNHRRSTDSFDSSSSCFSYDLKYADFWSWGITLLYTMFAKVPFLKCDPKQDSNFKKFVNAHICQQSTQNQKVTELTDLKFQALASFYNNTSNGKVLGYFTFSSLFKDLLDPIPENRSLLRFMESQHDYFFKVINDQEEQNMDIGHDDIDELEMEEEEDHILNFNNSNTTNSHMDHFKYKFSLGDYDDDDADDYNYDNTDCFDNFENPQITAGITSTNLNSNVCNTRDSHGNTFHKTVSTDLHNYGINFTDTPLDTPIETLETTNVNPFEKK